MEGLRDFKMEPLKALILRDLSCFCNGVYILLLLYYYFSNILSIFRTCDMTVKSTLPDAEDESFQNQNRQEAEDFCKLHDFE